MSTHALPGLYVTRSRFSCAALIAKTHLNLRTTRAAAAHEANGTRA